MTRTFAKIFVLDGYKEQVTSNLESNQHEANTNLYTKFIDMVDRTRCEDQIFDCAIFCFNEDKVISKSSNKVLIEK